MKSEVKELFSAAADDRTTLRLPVPDRVFGFHAQQAVEKMLKCLIAAHGQVFPWTHDLSSLLKSVIALGEQLPNLQFPLLSLQPYATMFRYSEGPGLDESTRRLIAESVDAVFSHVQERLKLLTQVP